MSLTKGPSSLDIIEQAMAEIYRSRQANLMQKSKRYMEKLAKKAEKQKGGFNRLDYLFFKINDLDLFFVFLLICLLQLFTATCTI